MKSRTLDKIQTLIDNGDVLISSHGYDELAEDHIFARDAIGSIHNAMIIEDYPDFGKGPCVLVLQKDRDLEPIHVVWGIPKGHDRPAVLITAYRPDPKRWNEDFTRRLP